MRVRGATRSTVVLVAGFLLMSVRTYAADRQIRPFIGATFGGGTTFLDLEEAVGKPNRESGASEIAQHF